MKLLLLVGLTLTIVCTSRSMTPPEIAVSLLACPHYSKISPGNKDQAEKLLDVLQHVAGEDLPTIREGLRIYQEIVTSADFSDTAIARGGAFTVPILFRIMFVFPKGKLSDFDGGGMAFLSGDRLPIDREQIIEYSLPVTFDEHGKMKLSWYFGGFTGHVNYNFTGMLDHYMETLPLRTQKEKRPSK